MKALFPFLFFASVAAAELVVVSDGPAPASSYRHVRLTRKDVQIGRDYKSGKITSAGIMGHEDAAYYISEGNPIPASYPSLVDTDADMWVAVTGTVSDAEVDLLRAKREARQAKRAAAEAAREERQAWKSVAQDWRQTGRDVAREIGLPAATGATWGVEAMYAALATVTNATARRDLTLRALAADLAQTRYQLEREMPAAPWWWVEEQQDE